jgi:ABC-2 type transport system permease protein
VSAGWKHTAASVPEIKRPSAFGDWRRSGHLVWALAKTEFRQQYATSVLGYIWTILEPVLFWAVLYLVLRRVLVFGEQIEHYAAFLLMNVVLWFFFRSATARAYRSVRGGGGKLVRRMEFPRAVLPISAVVAAGLTALGGVPVIFGFLLVTGVEPMWSWLLFPLLLASLFLFTAGVALLLAAIYARVTDIDHIWRAVLRILFWSTPIFYAIDTIPDLRMRDVIVANPLSLIFEQARIWMIDPTAPGVAEAAGSAAPVTIALAIMVGVCVIGPLAFARAAPRVAERV